MQTMQDKTIRELAKECKTVEDVHKMLRDLFKDTLQGIFEAEMEEHLGYKKHSICGNNSGNSRNGYSEKTIKSRFGKTRVKIPRDRNGVFCNWKFPSFAKIFPQAPVGNFYFLTGFFGVYFGGVAPNPCPCRGAEGQA